MKYDERACKFNMDTGCVELLLRDGRKISIDCTGVEDALDVTMAQRSELDYLIYNDPLGYADVGNHICGKTGGNPQVLFPHIALNQRVPEGFIAYVHLSSCLSPGSGVSVPIISKFLLFHKYFLTQPPVPSGLCFSFLFLITST